MSNIAEKKFKLLALQRQHPKLTAAAIVAVLLSAIFPRKKGLQESLTRLNYYFLTVLLVLSFVTGLLLGYLFLEPDTLLPNLFPSYLRLKKDNSKNEDDLTLVKKICPVCGKKNCPRHRPELNVLALQPWKDIKLPKTVNDALEEFLNLVLKEFVYAWYKDLSNDEAFVDQIRTNLRFVVSVLYRRLEKVDIPTFITHKILNAAMKHLHLCLMAKKDLEKTEGVTVDGSELALEHVVLQLYGKSLHCAAHNRRAELDYIKHLSSQIFPYVLPPHSLNCRSLCSLLREILSGAILLPAMDVLADPDKLNNLLLLFLDNSRAEEISDPPSPVVSILEGYSHPINTRNHAILHYKLADILAEPEILFPFMQFMKAEASVNVLQFYLSVEEFNSRILTPELTSSEQEELHQQLCDIYRMYVDPASQDCIRLEDDVIHEIQTICQGPYETVLKLQTSTPLFRAYELAYDLLEYTFLPLFHQSDVYYTMLCGERLPTKLQRSLSKSVKRTTDAFALSRLSSRIKCVFRTNTVEGRPLCDDIEYAVEDTDFTSVQTPSREPGGKSKSLRILNLHKNLPANLLKTLENNNTSRLLHAEDAVSPGGEGMTLDVPLRNLSSWRVSIPEVVLKPDPENNRKSTFIFLIDIRRIDIMEKQRLERLQQLQELPIQDQLLHLSEISEQQVQQEYKKFSPQDEGELSNWKIERRYHEFYVLDQKLAEFHGELLDMTLPPKKTFVPKNKEFFESQRDSFEVYLQKLLTKPVLQGSELVFSFLTSEQEFTTSFLEVNLGRKMRSGAMKLVKERGQHLEPFLKSLVISTENPKARPGSWMERDSDTVSISSEKMSNSVFNNNANLDLPQTLPVISHSPDDTSESNETSVECLTSIYDTIVYLAPLWFIQLLMALRMLIRNTLDTYLDWYLGQRIDRVLKEHRAVKIIHLLRDALFFDTDPPRTDEEKIERRDSALNELTNYIPGVFVQAVGLDKHRAGTKFVFNCLQQPTLNKQLSYVLLDLALEQLFPEILQDEDSTQTSQFIPGAIRC